MKLINKAALAVSAACMMTVSTSASAEFSANAGAVSQYFFRGIAQTLTASASAGVDYETGGFYVGTWAADVQDGIEVDFYGGYGYETEGGFGFSAGVTSYQYTGDFDSAYNEVNLGISFGMFSATYNIGQHEEDFDIGIPESDYDFFTVSVEHEGFYGTYGSWGKDFDGDYVELGYGTDVSGFDLGVALIINSEELDWETGDGDESLVFSIGKSF